MNDDIGCVKSVLKELMLGVCVLKESRVPQHRPHLHLSRTVLGPSPS